MKNDIVIASLDQEINEVQVLYGARLKVGIEAWLEAANLRIKQGILLLKRKEETPHGFFQDLFASAKGKSKTTFTFPFDYMTARNRMRLASDHPEPFKDFAEMFEYTKAMGQEALLLPAPASHANQRDHGSTLFSAITDFAGRFESVWTKFNGDSMDTETISPHGADQLLAQVDPLAERIVRFRDALKARALA